MARFTCAEEGCSKGAATGNAIYRTSPKGQPFEGKCLDHYDGPSLDKGVIGVVQAIEDDNFKN